MASATLIQIYYAEAQKEKCYPFSKLYYNESLTVFFENDVIARLVPTIKEEKIAICSWKLKEKLRMYIGQPRPITQQLLESDYEVLAFTRNTKHHLMLANADAHHPGFLKTFDKILKKIGVSRPGEVKIPIYNNSFSAQSGIYNDYVSTYLIPAMEVMKNDPEISELCMQDSRYSDLTHQDVDRLESKLGLRYYPMHTFILERLFSIYVQNKRIKVTPL